MRRRVFRWLRRTPGYIACEVVRRGWRKPDPIPAARDHRLPRELRRQEFWGGRLHRRFQRSLSRARVRRPDREGFAKDGGCPYKCRKSTHRLVATLSKPPASPYDWSYRIRQKQ